MYTLNTTVRKFFTYGESGAPPENSILILPPKIFLIITKNNESKKVFLIKPYLT
jgi:hypothetical protein